MIRNFGRRIFLSPAVAARRKFQFSRVFSVQSKNSSILTPISSSLVSSAPLYRTHLCRDLPSLPHSTEFRLSGFLQSSRSLGLVFFAVLRDYTGTIQIVSEDPEIVSQLKSLPLESSLTVSGILIFRPVGQENSRQFNGKLEFRVKKLFLHNIAPNMLPFDLQNYQSTAASDLRLEHRYLDLRRPTVQRILRIRAKINEIIREELNSHDFIEVETPLLFRSTPEGAAEFLVPTRHFNEFYALPQSPQQFKQLFMVGGIEKYYQFARCFRDEGMRADRQPEFTQLDIERSYLNPNELFLLIERIMKNIIQTILIQPNSWNQTGIETNSNEKNNNKNNNSMKNISSFSSFSFPSSPLPHYSYSDCIENYGSDKPDLRFSLPLTELKHFFTPELIQNSPFSSSRNSPPSSSSSSTPLNNLEEIPSIKAIFAPFLKLTRVEIEKYQNEAKSNGISLLILKIEGKNENSNNSYEWNIPKAFQSLFTPEIREKLLNHWNISEFKNPLETSTMKTSSSSSSHTIFLSSGLDSRRLCEGMGKFRLFLGHEMEKKHLISINSNEFHAFWVVNFPLFDGNIDKVQRIYREWKLKLDHYEQLKLNNKMNNKMNNNNNENNNNEISLPVEPKLSLDEISFCSTHHPFTRTSQENQLNKIFNEIGEETLNSPLLRTIPLKISILKQLFELNGDHYDFVMNGNEIGGGSIRIHEPKIQENILKLLGAKLESFEHLLRALRTGAPPHGGLALGLDRLIALIGMKLQGE